MSTSRESVPTVALVGCGAIADTFHLPALARHAEVHRRLILVDRDADRAASLAGRHGVARTASDVDQVLGEIDAAIVAVPAHLHHQVALACLEARVHVLCEKPLCPEPARAGELVATAESSGVALAVNQTRRLFPAFREVRERLAAGDLGRLQRLEWVLGEPFEWPAASDSYFGIRAGGRGVVLDTGAHVVDLVCWWLGGRPELLDYRDDSFGGTEAVAELALEHRGCRARVRLSWLSKLANAYRIEGERGSIEGGAYDWNEYSLRATSGGSRTVRSRQRVRDFPDLANRLIDNFIEVVRGRADPLVPAREVTASIGVIDECYARRARFDLPWHAACERLERG